MFRNPRILPALLLLIASSALASCAKSPATTPTPTELLDYTRQGGLLGTDDHLVVYDSGAVTLTQRGAPIAVTIDTATLDRLKSQIAAADFDHLDPAYGPEFGCCDQFTHRLRYRGRAVRALDDVAPERLRALLVTLSQIIGARRSG